MSGRHRSFMKEQRQMSRPTATTGGQRDQPNTAGAAYQRYNAWLGCFEDVPEPGATPPSRPSTQRGRRPQHGVRLVVKGGLGHVQTPGSVETTPVSTSGRVAAPAPGAGLHHLPVDAAAGGQVVLQVAAASAGADGHQLLYQVADETTAAAGAGAAALHQLGHSRTATLVDHQRDARQQHLQHATHQLVLQQGSQQLVLEDGVQQLVLQEGAHQLILQHDDQQLVLQEGVDEMVIEEGSQQLILQGADGQQMMLQVPEGSSGQELVLEEEDGSQVVLQVPEEAAGPDGVIRLIQVTNEDGSVHYISTNHTGGHELSVHEAMDQLMSQTEQPEQPDHQQKETPQPMPDQMAEPAPKGMPEQISDDVIESVPERGTDQMSEQLSGPLSEEIPERISQSTHQQHIVIRQVTAEAVQSAASPEPEQRQEQEQEPTGTDSVQQAAEAAAGRQLPAEPVAGDEAAGRTEPVVPVPAAAAAPALPASGLCAVCGEPPTCSGLTALVAGRARHSGRPLLDVLTARLGRPITVETTDGVCMPCRTLINQTDPRGPLRQSAIDHLRNIVALHNGEELPELPPDAADEAAVGDIVSPPAPSDGAAPAARRRAGRPRKPKTLTQKERSHQEQGEVAEARLTNSTTQEERTAEKVEAEEVQNGDKTPSKQANDHLELTIEDKLPDGKDPLLQVKRENWDENIKSEETSSKISSNGDHDIAKCPSPKKRKTRVLAADSAAEDDSEEDKEPKLAVKQLEPEPEVKRTSSGRRSRAPRAWSPDDMAPVPRAKPKRSEAVGSTGGKKQRLEDKNSKRKRRCAGRPDGATAKTRRKAPAGKASAVGGGSPPSVKTYTKRTVMVEVQANMPAAVQCDVEDALAEMMGISDDELAANEPAAARTPSARTDAEAAVKPEPVREKTEPVEDECTGRVTRAKGRISESTGSQTSQSKRVGPDSADARTSSVAVP